MFFLGKIILECENIYIYTYLYLQIYQEIPIIEVKIHYVTDDELLHENPFYVNHTDGSNWVTESYSISSRPIQRV